MLPLRVEPIPRHARSNDDPRHWPGNGIVPGQEGAHSRGCTFVSVSNFTQTYQRRSSQNAKLDSTRKSIIELHFHYLNKNTSSPCLTTPRPHISVSKHTHASHPPILACNLKIEQYSNVFDQLYQSQQMADLFWRQSKKPGRSASDSGGGSRTGRHDTQSFTKFEDQTKDAWDCADDEVFLTFSYFSLIIQKVDQNIRRRPRHLAANGKASVNAIRWDWRAAFIIKGSVQKKEL